MRSGKMRYRVQLQKPRHDDRRRGGRVDWEDVHVGKPEADGLVSVGIRQKRATETPTSRKQLVAIGVFEVRLWCVPGIDETWRLVHGQKAYNIQSIDQPNVTGGELVLICKRNKLKGIDDAS